MLKVYFGHTDMVEKPEVFIQALENVQENRRKKVLSLKHEEDRKRSLLAGILLRQALVREGLVYEKLTFSVTPEGKPYLEGEPNLHFSLSHSGDYAVCVLADKPVGVDLESIEREVFLLGKLERVEAMAKKCFSEKELEFFSNCAETEKKEMFLKYWTRKEAYSKAVGKGLGMDFSTIDTESGEAFFKSEWIKEGYMLSVCMMN